MKEVREWQRLTCRSREIGKLLVQIMRQVSTGLGAQKENVSKPRSLLMAV